MRRCVTNPVTPEYSLCGDAEDGYESGDLPEQFELAKDGESITCPACCMAIKEIKAIRNKLRPIAETKGQNHD